MNMEEYSKLFKTFEIVIILKQCSKKTYSNLILGCGRIVLQPTG